MSKFFTETSGIMCDPIGEQTLEFTFERVSGWNRLVDVKLFGVSITKDCDQNTLDKWERMSNFPPPADEMTLAKEYRMTMDETNDGAAS